MRVFALVLGAVALQATATAEVWVRWNQAGYRPDRPKRLVLMADRDLAGEAWRVVTADTGQVVLSGEVGPSVVGEGAHTPLPFNHPVDVSALVEPRDYRFEAAGATPAALHVAPQPYARFLPQILQHLRMVRSGSDDVPGRRQSHPGDARAVVQVPAGDPADGRWQPAEPGRTVDVRGGWYDAGDQIKFTLNEAYTVYVLLLAYRHAPELFPAQAEQLPAVLAEARHGLEFLARVYPDPDTFVIQVGDEQDHEQGWRLPENDALDGRRPALCALSRVHMGAATAALALGARTFGELGHARDAAHWGRLAERIHARAQRPGALRTAFERGKVNDFYHDPSDVDQQALAAVELFELTGRRDYLDQAVALAPPPAEEVGWADWHALANAALAPHDAAARERLIAETARYVEHAEQAGAPWHVPGRYVWGSLHRWIGSAHAARRASVLLGGEPRRDELFHAMVDYTFGRNNWGCAFLFSEDLPNTLRHLYSPLYDLLDRFPTGAVSEGPGNRSTHERLRPYFDAMQRQRNLPVDTHHPRFDTPAAVFADHAFDFMCQEATIGGQADAFLLLTLATAR